MIPEDLRKILVSQHYHIVGKHSAVKICHWTKKSIRDEGYCYKQKFYGISSHRCLQMSPSVAWCTHKCVFCWRNIEHTIGTAMDAKDIDEPDYIVDASIEAQRILLSGFGGLEKANKQKLMEAANPNQVAISLSGEPTIYPKIGELVDSFNNRGFTTFLVTNGTFPERIKEMIKEAYIPYQFYLSIDEPDEKTYKLIDNPLIKGGWKRISETLLLFPKIKEAGSRTVIRLTLVKGKNMFDPEGYGKIIEKASPDFVEIKAYMFVGASRQRVGMTLENMPSFSDIYEFSKKLEKSTRYRICDYKEDSRVVLMKALE